MFVILYQAGRVISIHSVTKYICSPNNSITWIYSSHGGFWHGASKTNGIKCLFTFCKVKLFLLNIILCLVGAAALNKGDTVLFQLDTDPRSVVHLLVILIIELFFCSNDNSITVVVFFSLRSR